MKKIIINKEKCIGCFKCKQVCYSVFEVGPDGKSKVRYGISESDIEDAKTAEICCPTGAISIIEGFNNNNQNESSSKDIISTILDIFS